MRHELNLTVKERINIWLDLCDFSLRLMKTNLSLKQFNMKLYRIREKHLRDDYKLLIKWSELEK